MSNEVLITYNTILENTKKELYIQRKILENLNNETLSHLSLVLKIILKNTVKTEMFLKIIQIYSLYDMGNGEALIQAINHANYHEDDHLLLFQHLAYVFLTTLATLHQKGFLLLDIKPENMLFSMQGDMAYTASKLLHLR